MLTLIKFATTATALYSAWLWYLSSKVEIVPTWAKYGGIEPPGAGSASDSGWIAGVLEASTEAARHNKRAALWTAGSIVLGVIGSWIH
jgi:hypothetical protein